MRDNFTGSYKVAVDPPEAKPVSPSAVLVITRACHAGTRTIAELAFFSSIIVVCFFRKSLLNPYCFVLSIFMFFLLSYFFSFGKILLHEASTNEAIIKIFINFIVLSFKSFISYLQNFSDFLLFFKNLYLLQKGNAVSEVNRTRYFTGFKSHCIMHYPVQNSCYQYHYCDTYKLGSYSPPPDIRLDVKSIYNEYNRLGYLLM